MPKTVVVIEDHPVTRLGLKRLIENSGELELAGEFADIAAAKRFLDNGGQADVALLDRMLPDGNGLSLVSLLKGSKARVIMLTVADEDREIAEAIESGVDGYVLKSADPDQILGAVRAVLDGHNLFPAQVIERMARGEFTGDALSKLSGREKEIVGLVAGGMSNKVIGKKLGLSDNTVRNHLHNIMEKLGLANRVQIATFALRHGLGTSSHRPPAVR
jgi:DNA-binding NarL/FixJ family response regulator